MSFSKKITAGAVALALGASAVVAPQATALPAGFVSPPGFTENPEQVNCNLLLSHTVSTIQPGEAFKSAQSGATVGAALEGDQSFFRPFISLSSQGERLFSNAEAVINVHNAGTQDATLSYDVKEAAKGDYQVRDMNGNPIETIVVTDAAVATPKTFSLNRDEVQKVTAKLAVDNDQDIQTWAWTITAPSRAAEKMTRVEARVDVDVEPWPIETDLCEPMLPSETQSQPIIADGNEYSTGITVANAADDYQRLFGTVSIGGKPIDGAQVRVDASGKVYVTLPKGSTGQVDNEKADDVEVKLLAKPREETADARYDSYSQPQVLREENDFNPGTTNGGRPEFSATVPVQQFKPEYDSAKKVKPGKEVNVPLKTLPGQVRDNDIAATYKVVNAPEGWTAEPATDGTLKVTAPAGAKAGDVADFTVEVAYPDGSVDTLPASVEVIDLDATVTQPEYDDTYGKIGAEVTLDQTKTLPKGSTFVITPGQDLGEWKPAIDQETGKITVTIPKNAKTGDTKTILVDVTYPDGSTDTEVPATVTVLNQPGYGEVTDKPGEKVELPHTGTVVEGSKFTINPQQDLGEWEPQVDQTTGTITVTIPENEKPGTTKTILIDVKDPKSGKTDTVEAKVIVHGAPKYGEVEKNPGDNVTLTPKKDNVPDGSTYELTPNQDLDGWDPKIDPTTGEITVTVPGDAKEGDEKTINVTVTYPSGKTDEVPAKVTVKAPKPATPAEPTPPSFQGELPKGNTLTVYPGTIVTLNPTVVSGNPTGTTFKLPEDWKVPEGWTITVDPATGKLTIIPAKNATPGTTFEIPVTITYPSGTTETRQIPVEVGETAEGTIPYTPGQQDPLIVYIPEGGTTTGVKLPEGWTVTRTDDNSITVSVPEGTKPGTYEVVFPKADGAGNLTVYVEVKDPAQGVIVAEQGSSENLQKCFANMSSESNPLLWLVPVGLLIAIGAPLAGPIGQELGKAAANVSAQMNIPNPLGNLGLGGERRPQPAWMAQIQIEAQRLQAQFGPEVTQAAAIGLSLAGLAAGLGVLAALCKDGDLPEWATSSTASGGEGSSAEGSSDKKDGEAAPEK